MQGVLNVWVLWLKAAICFQDSPTNKLLYAKEIPEYKKRVQCYYQQIQDMPPLSEQEMNAHLAEESRVSERFQKFLCVSYLVSQKPAITGPFLFFFLNVIKHVDIAPAEIQKWIQHQPGLDRNLQICQEIQKPGKRYSQCFFCVCDLIFGLDVLLLKQQPLFGRWNISVEPTCCIKFHRWISERDASVGKIAATLTDVTYCRHLHNLSRNALVENLQYFVVFFLVLCFKRGKYSVWNIFLAAAAIQSVQSFVSSPRIPFTLGKQRAVYLLFNHNPICLMTVKVPLRISCVALN